MRSSLLSLVSLATLVAAQWDGQNQTRNLTPDGFWHNRYFAILSMGSYGNYDTLCPTQTFTQAEQLKNFPNSTLVPWELIEEWGPTASGNQGFSAVIPEMNKVVVVFRGNPQVEANLALDVVPWSYIGINGTCQDCTMNAQAAEAYMEAKNATNNFEATRDRYAGAGLVYAITGLGFGGMLAQIHAVDYNRAQIAYYAHNQGSPRVFNPAGVQWFNENFNGEAGERAVWNNDDMPELIPASENYAHAGTTFKYWGFNETSQQPNWNICWPDVDPDALGCVAAPNTRDGITPLPVQDHYWAFTSVTNCGPFTYNYTLINNYIADNVPGYTLDDLPVPATWSYTGASTTTQYGGYYPQTTQAAATRASSPFGTSAPAPGVGSPARNRAKMLARWYGAEE